MIGLDGKTSAAGAFAMDAKIAASAAPNERWIARTSVAGMRTVKLRNQFLTLHMVTFSLAFSGTGASSNPITRHCRLCTPGERPCRRAADNRDELAPPDAEHGLPPRQT